jgi:hypothetical protein
MPQFSLKKENSPEENRYTILLFAVEICKLTI